VVDLALDAPLRWIPAVAGMTVGGRQSGRRAQPRNGSWTRPPVPWSACQARREDAAGYCLQGRATTPGAPSAVLAGA